MSHVETSVEGMKTLDAEVLRVAAEQHGAFTRRQAHAAGADANACARRLAAGAWLPTGHAGVYRLASYPGSWLQRVAAAVLAGPEGTVASHRAAAALLGLRDQGPVEVTVPPRGRNVL